MLGIAATFVVFILPYLQRRESRLQEKRLNADFKARIENAKKDLEGKITKLEEDKTAVEQALKNAETQIEIAKKDHEGKITKLEEDKTAVEQALKNAETRIDKRLNQARGTALHVRAATHFDNKSYENVIAMGHGAIMHYLNADDYDNLGRVLKNLITPALNHLNKKRIETFEGQIEKLSELETKLKEAAIPGELSEAIEGFVKAKNAALNRNSDQRT
jgi:Arc/MetJ family transcription regulator